MADHEANRGLKGLGERIRSATSRMPSLGMTALAQVTMSKLIDDYRALVPLLHDLGFEAVTFSYPQRIRLGSSSLAWSADSDLMNFTILNLCRRSRGSIICATRFSSIILCLRVPTS